MSMTNALTRRQLVASAAGAAGLAASGALAASTAQAVPAVRGAASSIEWGATCDVLVIGMGGAGAMTAISAAEEGAEVLLVEKAPEYLEGGNTRYSEQVMAVWKNVQDGVDFLKSMNAGFSDVMTDEVLEFMARETVESTTWFEEHGAPLTSKFVTFESPEKIVAWRGQAEGYDMIRSNWIAPQSDGMWSYEEYPIWPNGEKNDYRVAIMTTVACEKAHKGYWEFLRRTVEAYSDSISCWFNSPATKLIQDENGVVIGAVVDHAGEPVNVYARNGVVLACGSFEADLQKVETFTQRAGHAFAGSSYNTGDGLALSGGVGAQMWHMNGLSGPFIAPLQPGTGRIWWSTSSMIRGTHNGRSIFVCADGKRFMPECGYNHHGHIAVGDTYQNHQFPAKAWLIMDADGLEKCLYYKLCDDDQFVAADTIEELGAALGIDTEALTQTVSDYNGYCDAGHDAEFNRYPETLEKIEKAPFYGIEVHAAFVNCQGGPKRNTNCEVLDWDNQPIAHLYSAGELGSMWGGVYVSGGNVAETAYTGRVAGRNAAAAKDDVELLDIDMPAVNEITVYDKEALYASAECGEGEFPGCALGIHAPILVKIKVADGKLADIEVLRQFESPNICRTLFTDMPAAMVEQNTYEVDGVTGATIASRGLRDAVKDAMINAGLVTVE